MKTHITILCGAFAASLLTACVDRKALNGSTDKAVSPSIVITQPANKESIAPVVETLRESLNTVARATSGARVPNPHISILLADGKTLDVPAPKAGNAAFGDATPKARQERMEGHLKALTEKLEAGCTGQSVPSKVVKENPAAAFKEKTYNVWAAGGGANLWSAKGNAPTRFIEDRDTFTQSLADESKPVAGFLIVTDSTGSVAAKIKSKKAVATEDAKIPNQDASPDGSQTTQRAGDTVINVFSDTKSDGKTSKQKLAESSKPPVSGVQLPEGVEPLEAPILFDPGESKLTSAGLMTIRRGAASLKSTDGTQIARLFLVGQADAVLGAKRNRELSQERADAVRAALLAEGISVEQVIAIGESLAPDKASAKENANRRSVQMYILRTAPKTEGKLATQVKR